MQGLHCQCLSDRNRRFRKTAISRFTGFGAVRGRRHKLHPLKSGVPHKGQDCAETASRAVLAAIAESALPSDAAICDYEFPGPLNSHK